MRHLPVTLHGIVLAERMAFPIVRHHDAPQIRMSIEADSEQIEDFAFEVIRPRPNRVIDSTVGLDTLQANL